jgi:hypothetical protein
MKTKLTLENGSSKYGAKMGRRNEIPSDYSGQKLRLTRLPFVDGAYDRWGAYWGCPANIWCAWGETEEGRVRVFVRADDRELAKVKVALELVNHACPAFYL